MLTLRPVEGKDFVDREELLEEVAATLRSPNILIGFVFYGKPIKIYKYSYFPEEIL